MAAMCVLPSCGFSSESNSSSSSTDESEQAIGNDLSDIAGEWELNMPLDDAPGLLTIELNINNDGSGHVKVWVTAPGYSNVQIDEPIHLQRIDDMLLYAFDDGTKGNYLVEGNRVYSADGQPFSRK